jgi:transposase
MPIKYRENVLNQHDQEIVKEKIAKMAKDLLTHPPYSPDLAPSEVLKALDDSQT